MRKRVLFYLPSLGGGGAEKIAITLLKKMNREKFELHLALVKKKGVYLSEIPEDVKLYDLKSSRVITSLIPLWRVIWRLKPQVLFSTLSYANVAVLLMRKLLPRSLKIITREATIPSEMMKFIRFPTLWSLLYRLAYRNADEVICQSDYMLEDLKRNFGVREKIMHRIYNPVDFDKINDLLHLCANPYSSEDKQRINVVAAGRIDEAKGYERFLRSLPSLFEQKPHCEVWILGEGPSEEIFKNLCVELGISHKVHFIGFQQNPYPWLAHADLYVLSSHYEGLPNSLLDAIASGCPVLVWEHPGGTKEVMELTDQRERFVSSFEWNDSLFERPNKEVRHKLKSIFGVENIVSMYETRFLFEGKK